MSGSLVRSVRNVCFILRTTFPLQFLLFVTRRQIGIGKLLRVREALESSINAGQECRMLRVSNDFGVFFFREISRVALRFKITERIEYHDLASRKYAAWSLTISMRERWPLHCKAISKLHIITRQPRNVMRKDIARR